MNFPIVDLPKCKDSTNLIRNEFLLDCLPLINLIKSKYNLLNWNNNGYMYWDINNDKTLIFNQTQSTNSASVSASASNTGKIDFSLNLFEGTLPNVNTENIFNTLANNLNKFIGIQIPNTSDNIFIPVYYLFVNKNYIIFNLFITQYKLLKYDTSILENIFQYFKENNKFVKFSYKFNIFNISLLCDKFFDIVLLFLLENLTKEQTKEQIKEQIKEKLNIIFNNYDFVKLYKIINKYKSGLLKLELNSIYKKFVNETNIKSIPDVVNSRFRVKVDNIIEIENTDLEINNEKIIEELTNSIVIIRNVLESINILIPDFDKLFLMSILSYRLKEKLINGIWPFDSNNIFKNKFYPSKDPINNNNLKAIYMNVKPILYENSIVINDGIQYGNCMESTILQFFKILFYNRDKKDYDNNFINLIIKPQYLDKFKNVFSKIDLEEKTVKFDLDWVIFITNIPEEFNYEFGNYEFLKINKELNSTLNNLILALRYLTKINYNRNNEDFLNEIIKTINTNYTIQIIDLVENKLNIEKITINCYDTYILNLIKDTHAYFESSKITKASFNILEQIKNSKELDLVEYLYKYSIITYSDLLNVIFLTNLYKKNILFEEYLKFINFNQKKFYFDLLFSDLNITDSRIKKYVCYIIKNEDNIEYFLKLDEHYWNNTIKNFASNNVNNFDNTDFWINVINKNLCTNWTNNNWIQAFYYIKFQEFWDNVINKNLFIGWTDLQWSHAILNIEFDAFWDGVIDKDLYQNWTGDEWNLAIKNIKSDAFWDGVINKNLNQNWTENEWKLAIKNIKSDAFWDGVVNKNLYQNWTDDVLITAIENIKSENFWKSFIDKDLYLKWDNNIWTNIIFYIKFDNFWEHVINKNLCSFWDINLWNNAILNIKSNSFWEGVINKNLYIGWTNKLWNRAIGYIKFNIFWEGVINKDLYIGWTNNEWNKAIGNIESDVFWIGVINKNLCIGWTENEWNNAIRYIKFDAFWTGVIDKDLYISWTEDEWNYAIRYIKFDAFWTGFINKDLYLGWTENEWIEAIINIKSDIFWESVINKELYHVWESLLWEYATGNIKSNIFWEGVYNKNLYFTWDNNLWKDAIKDLSYEKIWQGCVDNNLYTDWSSSSNLEYNVDWSYAIKYIKSDYFWKNIQIDLIKNLSVIDANLILNKKKSLNDSSLIGGFDNNNFKNKYLKYKSKYLQLKKSLSKKIE